MDEKGRLTIPSQFRATLRAGDPEATPDSPTRLILNFGDHLLDVDPVTGGRKKTGCLRIYTVEEYVNVAAQVDAHPKGSAKRRALSYLYNTQREEMETDKEGRIILGADLRARLGMDKGNIRMLGLGDYLELHSEESYAASLGREVAAILADLAPGEDPLGLPVTPHGG